LAGVESHLETPLAVAILQVFVFTLSGDRRPIHPRMAQRIELAFGQVVQISPAPVWNVNFDAYCHVVADPNPGNPLAE